MDKPKPGPSHGRARFLSLLAAPLLFGACDFLSPFGGLGVHRLSVVLPLPPDSWAALPGLRFRLSWRGERGEKEEALVQPGSVRELRIPRGRFQALLAEPRCGSRALRPAGALYPAALGGTSFTLDAGRDRLVLDWIGGYVASVARALEEAEVEPSSYDLERLAEELRTRVSDPWLLPAREVARRLAAGSFRADSLREPGRFPVELPGPGPWAPESPFPPAPTASEPSGGFAEGESPAWSAWLPPGTSFFLGQELDLLVLVDETGTASWVRLFQAP